MAYNFGGIYSVVRNPAVKTTAELRSQKRRTNCRFERGSGPLHYRLTQPTCPIRFACRVPTTPLLLSSISDQCWPITRWPEFHVHAAFSQATYSITESVRPPPGPDSLRMRRSSARRPGQCIHDRCRVPLSGCSGGYSRRWTISSWETGVDAADTADGGNFSGFNVARPVLGAPHEALIRDAVTIRES